MKKEDENEIAFYLDVGKKFLIGSLIVIVSFWTYSSFIYPALNVYKQRYIGKAELAHAEYNRQISVCEAEAKKESANYLAQAEIIRAHGVAEANKIIGDSLKENESYLRYLWIQGLQTNNMQVVYVPTEANLPILECTRLNN